MKRFGWKIYKKYGKFSKITLLFKSKIFGYINYTWSKNKKDRVFFISPNNSVWASTVYRGPLVDVEVKAFIRKKILGHNFDVNKKKSVLMAIDAAFYASEEWFINRYKEEHHGLI